MAKRQATSKSDCSDEDAIEPTDDDGGRWAAKTALWAVLELDRAGPINAEQRAALFQLLMALDSLEYGKVHRMFKPDFIENRPVDTLDIRCGKALIAGAMDALMQPVDGARGYTREQAARHVARAVQARYSNSFGHDVTWKTIRGWRQNLKARVARVDKDHDVHLFHNLRAFVQHSAYPPNLLAEVLLDGHPWQESS